MNEGDLESVRGWFAEYCASFYSDDEEDQRNILLKEEHTHRVCANIIRIGVAEGLDGQRLLLAEVAALLHDVGRFEQYRQYRTFRDGISVNHATLGAEIIREIDLLADLFPHERAIVNTAVEEHNLFRIANKLQGDPRYYLQLVRDADKLDIWRVFAEYYGQAEGDRSKVVGLGLPDKPECTPEVLEKVAGGELVRLSSARTLNDIKLLQLSWIYDLSFPESFRIVVERDCIRGIASSLPESEQVHRAVDAVRNFAAMKVSAGACCQFNLPEGL